MRVKQWRDRTYPDDIRSITSHERKIVLLSLYLTANRRRVYIITKWSLFKSYCIYIGYNIWVARIYVFLRSHNEANNQNVNTQSVESHFARVKQIILLLRILRYQVQVVLCQYTNHNTGAQHLHQIHRHGLVWKWSRSQTSSSEWVNGFIATVVCYSRSITSKDTKKGCRTLYECCVCLVAPACLNKQMSNQVHCIVYFTQVFAKIVTWCRGKELNQSGPTSVARVFNAR